MRKNMGQVKKTLKWVRKKSALPEISLGAIQPQGEIERETFGQG